MSETETMGAAKTGRRRCRACGESYDYPGHKSPATRSHCERCVQIPAESRRTFELMRRRLDRLAKELEALKTAQK